MSISYRSPIYYFYFKISPNSYGRKSDYVSFIQVFLEKLSLDHDPISVFQQSILQQGEERLWGFSNAAFIEPGEIHASNTAAAMQFQNAYVNSL